MERMSEPKQTLSDAEVAEAALADRRHDGTALTASFRTRAFAAGLDLVNRIGASAEPADHHPDIALAYSRVRVALSSHDVGGLTIRDIRLARAISEHAAAMGVQTERGDVEAAAGIE